MNIAQYAIQKKVITLLFTLIFLIGGVISYRQLGRFEDPNFTIKSARVITTYPGASSKEVENEVTEVIENAVQDLPELDYVTSVSSKGLSIVTVEIKPEYKKSQLPAIWQRLRDKVSDAQSKLPPGSNASLVNDDFGDVYGILFAVSGEGFTYAELDDFVDHLKKELLHVEGIAKITRWGVQTEAIYIELSNIQLAQLGISQQEIYSLLSAQNLVTSSGDVTVGDKYIRISPTGKADSIEEIGNLVITSNTKKTIHLSDIAKITHDYISPPKTLLRFNGKPAIGLGISTVDGGNVVRTGEKIKAQLDLIKDQIPAGIDIGVIAYQSDTVEKAIDGFIEALYEAFGIVVITLIVTMGFRSGILQGIVMLITIGATMIFMKWMQIDLQRISLGALIIALGMLVDDAIVVNEGVLVNLEKGFDRVKSAIDVVKENIWALLAATVVNVLAFAAIGLSPDNTGEYCNSLFWVILISLMMSWVVAITITPLLASLFLKVHGPAKADPYASKPYQIYRQILQASLRFRWIAVGLMLFLLSISIYGFTFVKQSFFPDSDRNQFMIDYWLPQGSDINEVSKNIKVVEQYLQKNPKIENVSSFIGAGAPRFILTYTPENPNESYGLILVTVKSYHEIPEIIQETKQYINQNFPDAQAAMRRFRMGPGTVGSVKVRISGEESSTLQRLADEVIAIYVKNPNATDIMSNWRNQVQVFNPEFSEVNARLTGITKTNLSHALQETYGGRNIGIYRESNKLIPILARRTNQADPSIDKLDDIYIYSPIAEKPIPIDQIIKGVNLNWEDPLICRRNEIRTIDIQCDPIKGLPGELFKQIRPLVEAIPLPIGYHMEWSGEYEDSSKAQKGLSNALPMSYMAMALIVLILFNSVKQPVIIFLCLPLAIIGVTFGLLITNTPFGFMALLGFLSLSGMLIKNGIILIEHIDHTIEKGVPPYSAILDASVSRLRPVTMTAITASLGLIPLLPDMFFRGMAVTIIFGLCFATVLTLIIVPVLYAIFFKIDSK